MNVNSSATMVGLCQDPVPTGNVLDFSYGFNQGSANNGNVLTWAAVGAQTFNRSYTYDELNRLQTMAGTGGQCTGLSWTYDIWANRTNQTGTGGTCGEHHPTISNLNRIIDTGYQYDPVGNMTAEPGKSYQYDAENRMVSVNNGATASYVYDAQSRRVRKVAGGVTTEYIYDLANNVVAEQQGTTWTMGYVYLNGQLLAEYKDNTTYFAHHDHLGSTRLLTRLDQSVYDSLDFLPYGEQVGGDTGTTHKFTGKERDSESGLDNFGARYFASTLGRFMSPDPLLNSGRPWNPQTWNRYAYTLNNPLKFVDPFGLYEFQPSNCALDDKKCHKREQENQENFRKALKRLEDAIMKFKPGSKERRRLEAARRLYGGEGDPNGVIVGFGKLEGDVAGQTELHISEDLKRTITITFDVSKIRSTDDFANAAGHEGTHGADLDNPLFANDDTTLTPFQQEYRGYQTSVWVAQGLGRGTLSVQAGKVEIWNSSWSNVDRVDAAITRYLTTRERNPLPEKSPHNPWPD